MSKKSGFKERFEKEHGKLAQSMLKVESQHLHQIYWSVRRKLTYKMSLVVICKILRLFANPLSADDKYCLLNIDNSMQPIQMQLSQKQKKFSPFFPPFLTSSLNFEHFPKKDDAPRWCISEVMDSKKRA